MPDDPLKQLLESVMYGDLRGIAGNRRQAG